MLQHHRTAREAPRRVVVVGAAGFVGGAVVRRLAADGIPVLALGRADLDLLAGDAAARLTAALRPGDAVVAVAARAPCRNPAMLIENVRMAEALATGLAAAPVDHVVNISSDAVYADRDTPLDEAACTAPGSLHGIMHVTRELLLRDHVKAPLVSLRPSLLYGARDPHDGYGPNRFRRLAEAGDEIVLFGEGEERRDHVFIDDVADLVRLVLLHRSEGVLNVATGEVRSFRAVAEAVVALAGRPVPIRGTPRQGPMPHRGYRPFDPSLCRTAFPDFRYTPLDEGLARARHEMLGLD